MEKNNSSFKFETLEYKKPDKVKFPTLEMAKPIEDLKQRTKMLVMGMDKAGEFYRRIFGGLLAYVSNRIPEISDEYLQNRRCIESWLWMGIGTF